MEQNQTQIRLQQFDFAKLNELEHFLKVKGKLSVNTTSKYLKQLQVIFNRAIAFGKLDKSPFVRYKFKSEKTHREFLSQKELNDLKALKLDNESLERVKDVFLFAVYTGLRHGDVKALRTKSMKEDDKGNQWIEIKNTEKTGEPYRSPLLQPALEIVEKYAEEAEITGNLLPVISNQKINLYLKTLADLAGIDKHLTFHVARHTFATTVTLSNEVPMEIVSKMLGHRKLSTTQIYAKITNDYLMEQANRLNEKL